MMKVVLQKLLCLMNEALAFLKRADQMPRAPVAFSRATYKG